MRPASLLIASALLMATAPAATIANWKVLVAAPAGSPVAGATTDSPVFGGGANQMDAAQVAGRFGTVGTPASVSLLVGETLTVSATITLTGGTDLNNNYRFGVFNDGGQFAANSVSNWTGGWLHSIGNGVYQASTGASFVSTSGTSGNNAAVLTATSSTTTGALDGDSVATYFWTLSITRDSATTVDLSAGFTGGDGVYVNSYTVDNLATSLFTYTAVGILTSGNTDLDGLTLSGAQYSVVPEPSGVLLGCLGFLCLIRRRR